MYFLEKDFDAEGCRNDIYNRIQNLENQQIKFRDSEYANVYDISFFIKILFAKYIFRVKPLNYFLSPNELLGRTVTAGKNLKFTK